MFLWGNLSIKAVGVIAGLLLFFPLSAAEKQRVAPQADEARDFERAESFYQSGQESEALVAFSDYLRRYPNSKRNETVRLLLGKVYFQRRDFSQAAKEFVSVQANSASSVEARAEASVLLGECWKKLGFTDRAIIEWEAVNRRYPKSAAAKLARTHLAGEN